MKLLGFEIKRANTEQEENLVSFVEPDNDDGAITVSGAVGGAQSLFIDLEGSSRSEAELIQKYRSMMLQPEVQWAVDDIVNAAIDVTFDKAPVEIVTDDIEFSDSIKKKIKDEFDYCLELLDFSNQGYDIFQKWYVDGRLNYHAIINDEAPKKGIQELRYIDPRKIRKVREYENVPLEGAPGGSNVTVKKLKNEYYVYSEKGFGLKQLDRSMDAFQSIEGLKIAKDSIVHCNSGIVNDKNTAVLSHLHKAYKPLNQLRIMEDGAVIYRISRAPERRVFYIDVGGLPRAKAEQHLRDQMTRHKNRVVYNAATGEMTDDRKVMTITDDFWLPRNGDGRGTQIDTLAGGQNLGEMDDVLYFQRQLYKSLNVPVSRLEPDTAFSLGRSTEITQIEVKFSKFIRRLRARFSILFDKILEKQLILKGIIREEDWSKIKNKLRYDFQTDSHFEELQEAEVLTERLNLLDRIDQYEGKYFSKEYVQRTVLQFNDDDIKDMEKQIAEDQKSGEDDDANATPDSGNNVDDTFSSRFS